MLFVIAGLVSYLVTWLYLRYALKKQLLDVPNSRSSHSAPTPSAGGVGFVITLCFGLPVLWASGLLDSAQLQLYLPLLSLALVGYLDDRHQLPILWRLAAQLVVVVIVLAQIDLSGFFAIENPLLQKLLYPIAGLYLLWLVNLFNFMDGIDGIASVQLLSVLAGAMILIAISVPSYEYSGIYIHILLLGGVAGFLLLNWAPAKIFMGDTGSLLLGAWIGLASLETVQREWISLYSWLILMGVFITDASYTLLARLIAGESFYQAHCSHAYQRASRVYGHKFVVMAILAINLIWLFPLVILLEYWGGGGDHVNLRRLSAISIATNHYQAGNIALMLAS